MLRFAGASNILAFEKHYNATARPFDWKFTTSRVFQVPGRPFLAARWRPGDAGR